MKKRGKAEHKEEKKAKPEKRIEDRKLRAETKKILQKLTFDFGKADKEFFQDKTTVKEEEEKTPTPELKNETESKAEEGMQEQAAQIEPKDLERKQINEGYSKFPIKKEEPELINRIVGKTEGEKAEKFEELEEGEKGEGIFEEEGEEDNFETERAEIERKLEAVKKGEKETKVIELRHPAYKGKAKVLEVYEIDVDGAKVKVEITKDQMGTNYNLHIPRVSPATAALLEEIRNELISATTISMKELVDPDSFSFLKKRFIEDARKVLKEKLPNLERVPENFLVGILIQEMLGLGKIEFLIEDPNLEEIVIPSAKEYIRVYSKKYGWLLTNVKVEREEEIVNYSNIIARRVGRQITVLNPLLDAHLVTGDRINAVLYPIDTKGNTITVRKFARDPFTIIDFINNNTCNPEISALLWLAIEFEMNILISGGTGSGKTSFLNACLPFIPPNHRIISIEDTRELVLPEFLYWTPLVTRTANPEGKGEVSMLDLLINSLRMRPDRIVLGEMRRQQEAMVLFEAMHTGHSVYATVHADTAAETISRLVNPPLNVPPNLLRAVNLNVVMFRDRRRGIRRVLQIAELEASKGGAQANILYRWSPELDKIIKHSESFRFFEDVSRHTGMSQAEIKKDIEEKIKILSWLVAHSVRDMESFGNVMNLYYKNKEFLLRAINRGNKSAILGK
ncbi:CpaF family protein [Candidatus Pacearchaeota archaeon]|nr:CpaF family protein [Candidatus Pacearchaeota archaeon]